MKPAIEIRGLYKKFRRGESHDSLRDLLPAMSKRLLKSFSHEKDLGQEEFWALRDINASIGRGETVGIIGYNGAGKSTLLKHITGVLTPSRGEMKLFGRVSALIEVGAGFHPDLTGRENVFLNGVILGMTIAEVRRKFDEIVAFSELEEFIDTPVKRYSSGMFARLGFSVAAHLDPEILLIDEVLSVGDYTFQQKGLAKMRAVAEGGATVVFVSHNMRSVRDLCGRCLMLDKGALLLDGPTNEVVSKYLSRAPQLEHQDGSVIETLALAVKDESGNTGSFLAGSQARIEGSFRAREPLQSTDLRFIVRDAANTPVSVFSLSQLESGGLIDLKAGETFNFSLRIVMNLVQGPYTISIAVKRAADRGRLAFLRPELSFVVNDERFSAGHANLFPGHVTHGVSA
jgi:lipopolysaccharide transport system ATP-binding protein